MGRIDDIDEGKIVIDEAGGIGDFQYFAVYAGLAVGALKLFASGGLAVSAGPFVLGDFARG
jgi:hypothetical protein